MLLKEFCKACGFQCIDLTICYYSMEFDPKEFDRTDFSNITAHPEKLVVIKFRNISNEPNTICVLAR